MFCLCMNLKAALGCFLVITMNTVVSDIFIFGLDMVFKLSFVRHCKITAVHDIFIFMFCLWVNSKASFGCCLVLTMNTAVYDIFMFGLNMLFQILLGRRRKNTFFRIKSYIFMLWFYMNLKVLLGFCNWKQHPHYLNVFAESVYWDIPWLLPCNHNEHICKQHFHVWLGREPEGFALFLPCSRKGCNWKQHPHYLNVFAESVYWDIPWLLPCNHNEHICIRIYMYTTFSCLTWTWTWRFCFVFAM